jgi:hypothetical protein
MERPHIYVFKAAAATFAVAFGVCGYAASRVEHVQTETDASAEELQLGNSLAASDHHAEAVPHLQRALSIQRSQHGLFALRQQDTLKTLANSLTALNRVSEAQNLMIYRVRVAEKNDGVTNMPGIAPEDTCFHHVQVELAVGADGSVRDARIVDHDTSDEHARDILDAVRESRFRPKFVDGRPAAAPAIGYREVLWTGKPKT